MNNPFRLHSYVKIEPYNTYLETQNHVLRTHDFTWKSILGWLFWTTDQFHTFERPKLTLHFSTSMFVSGMYD
jgi:hypothetical protein